MTFSAPTPSDDVLGTHKFESYVQEAAGGGTAEELSKLAGLHDTGVITEAEFQAQNANLLA